MSEKISIVEKVRNFVRTYVVHLIIFFIYLFILFLSFFRPIFVKFVLLLFIFGLLVAFLYCRCIYKIFYRDISKKSYLNEKNHVAIIIPKYSNYIKFGGEHTTDFNKLFSNMKKRELPFAVYVINSVSELQKIIDDEKVKALLIFGHGIRHGVLVNDVTLCHYCELKKRQNIAYIAQYHCNDKGGQSLKECFGCEGDVTNRIRTSFELAKIIKSEKLYLDLKRALK
ncbi:MAG: hypothetical protein V1725_02600 [archaeon]